MRLGELRWARRVSLFISSSLALKVKAGVSRYFFSSGGGLFSTSWTLSWRSLQTYSLAKDTNSLADFLEWKQTAAKPRLIPLSRAFISMCEISPNPAASFLSSNSVTSKSRLEILTMFSKVRPSLLYFFCLMVFKQNGRITTLCTSLSSITQSSLYLRMQLCMVCSSLNLNRTLPVFSPIWFFTREMVWMLWPEGSSVFLILSCDQAEGKQCPYANAQDLAGAIELAVWMVDVQIWDLAFEKGKPLRSSINLFMALMIINNRMQ